MDWVLLGLVVFSWGSALVFAGLWFRRLDKLLELESQVRSLMNDLEFARRQNEHETIKTNLMGAFAPPLPQAEVELDETWDGIPEQCGSGVVKLNIHEGTYEILHDNPNSVHSTVGGQSRDAVASRDSIRDQHGGCD